MIVSSSRLPITSISTWRVNVVSVCTSDVSRATSTPARSLSKNGIEQPLQVLVRGDAERAEEALAGARGADDDEPLEQRHGSSTSAR